MHGTLPRQYRHGNMHTPSYIESYYNFVCVGESTFFVEVSETSVILHHSTINSLILLDELGRIY